MPQLRYEQRSQDWKDAAKAIEGTIYGAARAAFQDLAIEVQSKARAEISGAGFKGKWVSGFRTYVFPKVPNETTELTMRGFHSYNIANVFERGANIAGKPLLWIPLPTAPNSVQGKATTPARLIAAGVRLHKIDRGGRTFLIGNIIRPGAKAFKKRSLVKLPRGRFFIQSGPVTLAQLLNAQRNIRRIQTKRAFGAPIGLQTVSLPLFIGIRAIELRRRFNISAIYDQGRLDLPDLYNRRIAELIFNKAGKAIA